MDIIFAISLITGTTSIVLAIVAIWYSNLAEKKSSESYQRTNQVLSDISQKAAVIESTVSTTQEKLVNTITDIATPHRETQEEMFMKKFMENPASFQQLITLSDLQSQQEQEKQEEP